MWAYDGHNADILSIKLNESFMWAYDDANSPFCRIFV